MKDTKRKTFTFDLDDAVPTTYKPPKKPSIYKPPKNKNPSKLPPISSVHNTIHNSIFYEDVPKSNTKNKLQNSKPIGSGVGFSSRPVKRPNLGLGPQKKPSLGLGPLIRLPFMLPKLRPPPPPKSLLPKSWSLPNLMPDALMPNGGIMPNLDFGIQSKLDNVKNMLFEKNPIFTKMSTSSSDLQPMDSLKTENRKIPPNLVLRRQRYIPYFTILPQREYMKQTGMMNRIPNEPMLSVRKPKRHSLPQNLLTPEEVYQKLVVPKSKKDPNADLESFGNFDQEYNFIPKVQQGMYVAKK